MNTEHDRIRRLLDLFSTEHLKDGFGVKGVKDVLLDDFSKKTIKDLEPFLLSNFQYTKQHVYLFENKKEKVPTGKLQLFQPAVLLSSDYGKGSANFLYLVRVGVDFVVEASDGSLTKETVEFYWPVKVTFERRFVMVRCTVMERDQKSLFPNANLIGFGKKKRDEEDFLKEIADFLEGEMASLDINKGVKHLWYVDSIDAVQVNYRKARSLSSEIMDEKLLVKANDVEIYKQVVKAPILNTIFIFIKDAKDNVSAFVCNPTAGTVRFPRYCKGTESTDHVLRKILDHNW